MWHIVFTFLCHYPVNPTVFLIYDCLLPIAFVRIFFKYTKHCFSKVTALVIGTIIQSLQMQCFFYITDKVVILIKIFFLMKYYVDILPQLYNCIKYIIFHVIKK